MSNLYVNLNLTTSGAGGTSADPYGNNEWIENTVALDVLYLQGSHTYATDVTLNDRIFTMRNWLPYTPWRINAAGYDIDFKTANIFYGIIVSDYLNCNSLYDCYVQIENYIDQWIYQFDYTVMVLETASANIDRGILNSTIYSDTSASISNGSIIPPLNVSAVFTNRSTSADLFDYTHSATDIIDITYNQTNSVIPTWDSTDLISFAMGAPNDNVPEWARTRLDVGHIGSFYFGGDYQNGIASVEPPEINLTTETDMFTVSGGSQGIAAIRLLTPEKIAIGNNPFDFDFSGTPISGSTPLNVKFTAYNYEPTGEYAGIYQADEFRWWFDYATSGGVDDYISCASDEAEYLYCGFYGDEHDVRLVIIYEQI